VLERALSLLVPPACLACRAPLGRAGEPLCGGCRAALPWLGEGVCPRCALPRPCGPCPARRAAFTRAWAPFAHDGPARDLVGALKFRGTFAAADVMAAQIAANLPSPLRDYSWLVPVPPHPANHRARGFDQAYVLARMLARRTRFQVSVALDRDGPAERQLGAGRSQRRARGRIELTVNGRPPAAALLVDDVHTTGATLEACARALRRAGTERVAAITYTRTLP
jgi:predicted amidophosphoribosyltransferase